MTGAPDIAGGAPIPRPADTPRVWHHPLNRLPWAPPDAGRKEMTEAQTVVIRPWEPGGDDALLAGFVPTTGRRGTTHAASRPQRCT
jgi:hypothetical protein